MTPLFANRYRLLTLAFLVGVFAADAQAIPLFARKYNVSCFTCHVSPPMLNEFGKRFLHNGYQLPGSVTDVTPQHDNVSFPFAFITHPLAAHERETDNIYPTPTKVTTVIEELELELFSTSSLGAHFSYFTEVEVGLDGSETELGVGSMYVLYTDVLGNASGNLNFRLGKLPLLLPFSHTSNLHTAHPLIFSDEPFRNTSVSQSPAGHSHSIIGKAVGLSGGEEEEESGGSGTSSEPGASPINELRAAEPQFALSAFGIFPEVWDGLHWEVAYSAGELNAVKLQEANAIFIGLSQTLPISNTLVNIGAFYYGGKQSVTTSGYGSYPRTNNHYRAGGHLEFYDPWINRLHFYGMYVIGSDDNVDFWGKTRKVNSFLTGLDVIVMPEKLYAFASYDKLQAPDVEQATSRIDAGLRYHILPNMIVTAGFAKTDARYVRLIGLAPVDADFTTTTATFGILIGY